MTTEPADDDLAADDGGLRFHGPYGMALVTTDDDDDMEVITKIDDLEDDLSRWAGLIRDGRGGVAMREIEEVLIGLRNAEHPTDRILRETLGQVIVHE